MTRSNVYTYYKKELINLQYLLRQKMIFSIQIKFFLMLLLTIKNVYSFTPLILYLNKVETSNFSFIAKLESKEELKFTFMQMFALNLIFMIFIPNVKCDNKDRIKR